MATPLTRIEQSANQNFGPIEVNSETVHPDGKPWGKCCRGVTDLKVDGYYPGDGTYIMRETPSSCQCAMRRPSGSNVSRLDHMGTLEDLKAAKGRFFCIHRKTEDGYYRECAGWAAKYSGNRP